MAVAWDAGDAEVWEDRVVLGTSENPFLGGKITRKVNEGGKRSRFRNWGQGRREG
jgi:hypothetical protein